jgi:hypothetical protein
LINGKKDEVIYGHVGLCQAALLSNMIYFLELVLPENENERFWPEAKGRIHIDAWREVSVVDNFFDRNYS